MQNHNQSHGLKLVNSTDSQTAKSTDSMASTEIFDLLSSSRRQAIIRLLHDHENLSKRELVERVTSAEYGLELDDVRGTKERQTIHTSLHQTHIPRLEKAGVIEKTGDRISVGPAMDEFLCYLTNRDDSLTGRFKRSLSALC